MGQAFSNRDFLPGQYVTLDSIVKNVMNDEGRLLDTHLYVQYAQYAIMGLKELYFDSLKGHNVKSVILDVKDNFTVDLPDDYVQYRMVGVIGDDGNVYSLGKDRDLGTYVAEICTGDPVREPSMVRIGVRGADFNDYYGYYSSHDYGALFGFGGGQNRIGRYNIDSINNRIVFGTDIRATQIVLIYVFNPDWQNVRPEDYRIHVFAEQALISYVHWRRLAFKRNTPPGLAAMRKKEYLNEKRLLRKRLMHFNEQEYLDASRRHFKNSPKR